MYFLKMHGLYSGKELTPGQVESLGVPMTYKKNIR